MAKKIKDKFEKTRTKFAKHIVKSKKTPIKTHHGEGVIESINKYEDRDGAIKYKTIILYEGTFISGHSDTNIKSVIEALKHMELQGTFIKDYME